MIETELACFLLQVACELEQLQGHFSPMTRCLVNAMESAENAQAAQPCLGTTEVANKLVTLRDTLTQAVSLASEIRESIPIAPG